MKILNITVLGISILSLLQACGQSGPVTLAEADKAYFQMKPDKALEYYQKIWTDTSYSLEDKTVAGRKLATMHWHLYKNAPQAVEVLEELENLNYETSKCYQVWTRILVEGERFDEAIDMAEKAISTAESESSLYRAQLSLVKAVHTKYQSKVLAGSNEESDFTASEFGRAYEIIQKIVREKPGDILASDLYLGMSILADQPQEAYYGWLSFFRADEAGNVHKSLTNAQGKLKSAWLATDAAQTNPKNAVLGLAQSGFLSYAMVVAEKKNVDVKGDTRLSDLANYFQLLEKIRNRTIEFYQNEVVGQSSQRNYEQDLRIEAKAFWDKLSWEGKAPKFKDEKFVLEIEERFNSIARLMKANGHFGLSLGFIVLDEEREVLQYGKQGTLRYIAIDHMLSNGYSSWFWDGRAQIGGWAPDESSILQVRSAYNKGPINAWLKVSDSVELKKTLAQIEEKSTKDDQIALDDPTAYLPGLSARVDFNAINRLYNDLKADGLEGSELRATFINTYENLVLEASIFAHEGRHAIDKKYTKDLDTEELEYRAKLSEIYFSERPFLAIDAVLSPNIGDGTSHGDANKRVLKGIVGWMEKNRAKIEGLDLSRPYLPQLDQLTDEQLKAAVNSLDPFAN